jgi:Uroporphyrinogen decarboxylase (URO-D)
MERKWAEMSAEEKRVARFEAWISPQGVQFQSPETAATYKAAAVRFRDAVQMEKTPDRVPVLLLSTFMPSYLYGVTAHEAMYDTDKLVSAHKRFLQEYGPDYYVTPALIGAGKIFDILDYKQYKWPGHGISEQSAYQAVEGEYMLPEDYEALIDDPSDFWVRRWMPRVYGALEPLKNLSAFTDAWEVVLVSLQMIPFGVPPVQNALKALMDAGNEAMAWIQKIAGFETEAKAMGFPSCFGGATKAPFDIIGDTLRGTRGMIMDMYRRPDMVLKAVERFTPLAIKQGVGAATMNGCPVVFIPLHKGADGFMSDEQFRKFYWPTLKALILGLVDEGCVPFLFCEGSYNTRLEYLKELPKGSCLWIFDRTDMAKVKQFLGGKLCVGGNVPSGMILTDTPEKVKAYCKELIDVVGKGGGYIMSFGTSMDEGKAETVHAMVDFTKEYGVYR